MVAVVLWDVDGILLQRLEYNPGDYMNFFPSGGGIILERGDS